MVGLFLPEPCSFLVSALVLCLKTPGCHLETATWIWFLAYEALGSDPMRASLEKFQFDLVSMENEHCRMGNLSPACGKRTPPSCSQIFKIYQLLVTSSELSFAADSWMNSSCLCILCSTSMAFPASVYPSSTTVDFIFLFFSPSAFKKTSGLPNTWVTWKNQRILFWFCYVNTFMFRRSSRISWASIILMSLDFYFVFVFDHIAVIQSENLWFWGLCIAQKTSLYISGSQHKTLTPKDNNL